LLTKAVNEIHKRNASTTTGHGATVVFIYMSDCSLVLMQHSQLRFEGNSAAIGTDFGFEKVLVQSSNGL